MLFFEQNKPAELVHKEKSILIKFDFIKIQKGLTVNKLHTEVYLLSIRAFLNWELPLS